MEVPQVNHAMVAMVDGWITPKNMPLLIPLNLLLIIHIRLEIKNVPIKLEVELFNLQD